MAETMTVTVQGLSLEFTYTNSTAGHVLVRVLRHPDTMMTPADLRVLAASIGHIAVSAGP